MSSNSLLIYSLAKSVAHWLLTFLPLILMVPLMGIGLFLDVDQIRALFWDSVNLPNRHAISIYRSGNNDLFAEKWGVNSDLGLAVLLATYGFCNRFV